METIIELDIVNDRNVRLPDSDQTICLLRDLKPSCYFDGIKLNEDFIKQVSIFLYQREQLTNELTKTELEFIGKELEAAESSIKTYEESKGIYTTMLNGLKNHLDETKNQIQIKEKEKSELEETLTSKDSQTKSLKDEIDGLIKEKLTSHTKQITESLIKEIHYVLSNESKDHAQIDILNATIAILRNTAVVDHVTANVIKYLYNRVI